MDKELREPISLKEFQLKSDGVRDQQRQRLVDLFQQIEKEFELIWEENQELRRRLEDSTPVPVPRLSLPFPKKELSSGSITSKVMSEAQKLNPLKKKEIAEWTRLTQFVGHFDGIWEISMCRWANFLATSSADRTVKLWATNDFSLPAYTYVGHKGSVNSVRFHPTTRLVCSASGDSTCHLWRIPKQNEKEKDKDKIGILGSPKEIKSVDKPATLIGESVVDTEGIVDTISIARATAELKHDAVVIGSDWMMGGEKIATACWDNTIKLWSSENAKPVSSIEVEDGGHWLTFIGGHPSQPLVLTSSSDGTVRLWDFKQGNPHCTTIPAHTESVNSSVFVPSDDNFIVTGSDDRTVKIWDRRYVRSSVLSIRCSSGVNRVSISPQSSYIAIPLDDGRTKVADFTGKQMGTLQKHDKKKVMVSSAAWSHDESVIFTTGFDCCVVAWGSKQGNSSISSFHLTDQRQRTSLITNR